MLSPYILPLFGENVQAGLLECSARTFCPFLVILSRYILPILGLNEPAGLFECSAGTFCPFLAEMYRLGCLNAQPVPFAHFWLKCTGWAV